MNIDELYKIYLQNPSVQTDTRKLKKGDLYFALKGPNFNGNSFARQAINTGATYAIIDENNFAINGKTILVDNVLNTLQNLARHHRLQFNIPFIAITGSNGKTTTKELIHIVLSTTYKTYTTEGNLNNHIGVPLTILKINTDAAFALIEMGANHLGEIASYCKMAMPTHGLITNCGKAHLEGFETEEGVRRAKGELFDYLKLNNGTAFVMQDYNYLKEMAVGIQESYMYGTEDGEVVGNILSSDPLLEVEFIKGICKKIKTNLVGSFNLPNVLAAVAVGKYFSVNDDKIKTAIENYFPSNSRSQLVQKGNNKIILDAYNANPTSMKLAIENFAKAKEDNKILVLGAMAELGNASLEEHMQVINEIAKYQWKKVILVGGDFLNIDHPYFIKKTADDAGQFLQQHKIENAFLLIKGSRSTQMEKVLDYL
ncbi:MAG: UDP-N-acetylmuramoyl-tripeptide--D-alanyl-D-alanine ligase [Bacteroidota bacterium]|nr:UDP-N-acetylmuramoyl-tripeptide--D-alanyl-D-alanine ligase [Bacteroidota bacterium]